MPVEHLIVRGTHLDARHPGELHDVNAMICTRISDPGIGSVEQRIVNAQVERYKGPETRYQHGHRRTRIPLHAQV